VALIPRLYATIYLSADDGSFINISPFFGIRQPDINNLVSSRVLEAMKKIKINLLDMWECVDKFSYLGDMMCAGSGAKKASGARVQCAYAKRRKLVPSSADVKECIPQSERKGIQG